MKTKILITTMVVALAALPLKAIANHDSDEGNYSYYGNEEYSPSEALKYEPSAEEIQRYIEGRQNRFAKWIDQNRYNKQNSYNK